ncbi:MAG: DUF4097 family beta strand repeat protein [Clostridia bacterium]|nr:DUF4097 family beta strand repeat protein [Clostridia bacterium]
MKNNLKNYLQSLFSGAPHNSANDALFEELYGNLCDRYDEWIAEGLSEEEAYARAVGEVGDIRPLIDWRGAYRSAQDQGQTPPHGSGASFAPPPATRKESKKRRLPPAELRRAKHIRAWSLALAVMLYIVWLVPVILWEAVGALFICVAAGTVIIVLSNTRIPTFLDDSKITYDQNTLNADSRTVDLLTAFGIACCILCILPAALMDNEWGAALMFVVVAIGVGMILLASGIRPRAPQNVDREAYAAQTVSDFSTEPQKRRNRWLLPVILVAVVAVISCVIWLCISYDFEFGFFCDDDTFTSYTEVGNGEVTEKVDTLSIYWYAGSVNIRVYDGENISITETVGNGTVLKEEEQIRWGVHDGKLSIRHNELKKLCFHWGKRPEKQLTVLIPQGMARALYAIEVTSVSAPITAEGIGVSAHMELDSTSGRISLTDVTANRLEIDTVSGEISLYRTTVHTSTEIDTVSGYIGASEVVLGNLGISSVSADISVFNANMSSVEIDTTSGNTTLHILSLTARVIECDSVSGSICLQLPPEWGGFTVNYDSVSGTFDSDFATVERGELREYGDGSTRIEVDTTSGSLSIRQQP